MSVNAQKLNPGTYVVEVGKGGKTKVAPLSEAVTSPKSRGNSTAGGGGGGSAPSEDATDSKAEKKKGGGFSVDRDVPISQSLGRAQYRSKKGNVMEVAILWVNDRTKAGNPFKEIDKPGFENHGQPNMTLGLAFLVTEDGELQDYVKDFGTMRWLSSESPKDSGQPAVWDVQLIDGWREKNERQKAERKAARAAKEAEYQAKKAEREAAAAAKAA